MKIDYNAVFGRNKTCLPELQYFLGFECKNLTLLLKAGKYFLILLQSCQDGRRHFIGLLVLFGSLCLVLDVGRTGCWR